MGSNLENNEQIHSKGRHATAYYPHLQKRTTNQRGENPMWTSPITKLARRNAFFHDHEKALKETSERATQVGSELTGYAGQAYRTARITSVKKRGKQSYGSTTGAYTPHGKPQHRWNIKHPTG